MIVAALIAINSYKKISKRNRSPNPSSYVANRKILEKVQSEKKLDLDHVKESTKNSQDPVNKPEAVGTNPQAENKGISGAASKQQNKEECVKAKDEKIPSGKDDSRDSKGDPSGTVKQPETETKSEQRGNLKNDNPEQSKGEEKKANDGGSLSITDPNSSVSNTGAVVKATQPEPQKTEKLLSSIFMPKISYARNSNLDSVFPIVYDQDNYKLSYITSIVKVLFFADPVRNFIMSSGINKYCDFQNETNPFFYLNSTFMRLRFGYFSADLPLPPPHMLKFIKKSPEPLTCYKMFLSEMEECMVRTVREPKMKADLLESYFVNTMFSMHVVITMWCATCSCEVTFEQREFYVPIPMNDEDVETRIRNYFLDFPWKKPCPKCNGRDFQRERTTFAITRLPELFPVIAKTPNLEKKEFTLKSDFEKTLPMTLTKNQTSTTIDYVLHGIITDSKRSKEMVYNVFIKLPSHDWTGNDLGNKSYKFEDITYQRSYILFYIKKDGQQ